MKSAVFEYVRAASLTEACDWLRRDGDEAKLIAGGQSLVPMMAMRLTRPARLIDINEIAALKFVALEKDVARTGACTRQCVVAGDDALAKAVPLLRQALAWVGHVQTRNRGTVGGSLAHADLAAELPGIAVTCDAEIIAVGAAGSRTVPAADFFLGPLMTSLALDEIIVEMRLPPWPDKRRWGFEEFARQRGGFAMAGVALFYDEHAGLVQNAHIGIIGASSRLQRIGSAEAALNGRALDENVIVAAARAAAAAVDPVDDMDATAEYRRALVATLVERALRASALSK